MPGRYHNHPETSNPWGYTTKGDFATDLATPIRCPMCSNLAAPDMTLCDPGGAPPRCWNCGWQFTKAQARDMVIEALQVKVMGGWDAAKLEALKRLGCSGYVGPDGAAHPMDDTCRRLAAGYIAIRVRAVRAKQARQRLIKSLRRRVA